MAGRPATARRRRFLALFGAAILVVGCSTTGPTLTLPPEQSSQPTDPATTGVGPTEPAASDSAPTGAPPTEAPPAPTTEGTLAPGAKPTPNVTALKVPSRPDCNADNGTGTVGYIHISWTAEGTEGVRVSIDPPSPAEAYGYGFADYPAIGGADVPFACGAPNHDANGDYHLYVVTTIHAAKTYYAWRFLKVYQKAP